MKMKNLSLKKWTGFIAGASLLLGMNSCSHKNIGNVTYKCDPEVLEAVGDQVPYSVTGRVAAKAFPKKVAVEVKPFVVYGDKHQDTLHLEKVYVRGENIEGDGQQIKFKGGGSFSFTGSFPYSDALKKSEFKATLTPFTTKEPVKQDMKHCKGCSFSSVSHTENIAQGVISTGREVSVSALDVLVAPHGYQKEVEMTSQAKLYFPVNSSHLNMHFTLNKDEESKKAMKDLFDFMSSNYVIRGISVDGWASPEGELKLNDKLAENRAKAAEKYFRKAQKENLRDIGITANGKGPDWNGFVSNVRKAKDFKEGDNVLRQINAQTPDNREGELQKMMSKYPQIKKEFLPNLRCAEITITALEPRHSDGELREMAISSPSDLSVAELLYAATLYPDFENKAKIYQSAAQLFPNNWKALNNYAASEITKGNFSKAETTLNKANSEMPNQKEVLNNLGVVAAHKGDFEAAANHFNKAEQNNADESYNKAVLDIRKGDYDKAYNVISKRKCDYNLALSQVMNKKYSAAEKTLECSEKKDAQTYYLLSVIGARTNKVSMITENLQKAIQMDGKFKSVAANDMEFLKFKDNEAFKALIK